jgi:hypothetical protein
MVNTPMPPGAYVFPVAAEQYENPSIWASSDGVNWVVPAGLTNPIVPAPTGGYNADTDIYYDEATNKLYVVYKDSTVAGTMMTSSSDGVNWTTPFRIYYNNSDEFECVSPCLLKINDRYYIYYYTFYPTPYVAGKTRRISCSTIDGIYSNREDITMPNIGDAAWWHFDVIKYGDYFWMSNFVMNSNPNVDYGSRLYILASVDGVHFYKNENAVIIAASPYGNFYRSSIMKIGDQSIIYYQSRSLLNANKRCLLKMDINLIEGSVPLIPQLNGFTESISATPIDYRSVILNWDSTSDNAEGYSIQRSLNGSTWTEITTVKQGVLTYSDSIGLSELTLYYYRITAFRNGIYGDYSNCEVTTPMKPQNLIKYSEDLSNALWTKNGIIAQIAQGLDVNGNNTMNLVTSSVSLSSLKYEGSNPIISVAEGDIITFAFDVKRGTMTNLKYCIRDQGNATDLIAPTSYYSLTSNIVQRLSFQVVIPSGCTNITVYPLRDSGSIGTVYLGRVQVSKYVSDYIKTTAAIVI